MKKHIVTLCLAAFAMTSTLQAGFITAVTKTNGNDSYGSAGAPNLDWVALSDSDLARNDRTHQLLEIPDELLEDNASQPNEIAEMIQLSNSDKGSADVNIQVTVNRLTALYVGIDNRQFDNGGGKNLQTTQYDWMSDQGFTGLPSQFINTGAMVGLDENGNGEANQYLTLFAAIAPAGTYTLGPHVGGGNNMYVVFADDHLLSVVPEPASMSLIGFGGLGMLALRRRRK